MNFASKLNTESSAARASVCPRCHARIESTLACGKCGALGTIDGRHSHFAVLNLPESFEQDAEVLSKSYRAAARLVHPDRFQASDTESQAQANRLSARVNQAYRTLANPLLRAEYLLELAGGPAASDVREVPGALLMEVMEWRERLEGATAGGDDATLQRLRGDIAERRKGAFESVVRQVGALRSATPAQREDFRRLLNGIRYYDNLLREIPADPTAMKSR